MSTTTAADGTIERELRIAARPATVFTFWTDPERMARWMGREFRLDPRPGGEVHIDYNGEDIVRGSFVTVEAPTRLVFTWGWAAPGDPTPPGASTVEVTLEADVDETILRLRHSGLAPDTVAGHATGWDQFLPALISAANTA